MKRSRLLPGLLAGLFLLSAATSHAKLETEVKKIIAKSKIGTNVDLVSLDVYDGISIGAKYRIQSEPSYLDGYYTRLDKYSLNQNVSVGDLIEDLDLPFTFNIGKNSDILFARQFKSQKESLTAIPYTLLNFPLSADRALNKLVPGDFVSFETNMSVVVGVSATTAILNEILSVGAYSHVVASGQFMVHIFRMPDDRLRVKLIAVNSDGITAGVRVSAPAFEIFGTKIIDRQIRRIAKIQLPEASKTKSVSDLFMLDYVFDLKNREAAQAFTDLMTKKTRFKDVAVMNPLVSASKLADDLLVDASHMENLFQANKNLAASQRPVDRIFKGTSSAVTQSSNFRFGLAFIGFDRGMTYTQNRVVSYDKNDIGQSYILDNFVQSSNDSFLFRLFADDTDLSASLLFATDRNFNPTEFVALTMTREQKMKSLSQRELRKVQEELLTVLPPPYFAQINWQDWSGGGDKTNAYLKHSINFLPAALKAIPAQNWRQFYASLVSHLEGLGGPRTTSFYGNSSANGDWKQHYHTDIYYISKGLETVFAANAKSADRHAAFVSLKKFPMWRKYAAGFLIKQLPQNRLQELMTYELRMSAKGKKEISYKFGKFEQVKLYQSLMYVQSVITNRSYDLRLYADSNGDLHTAQQ